MTGARSGVFFYIELPFLIIMFLIVIILLLIIEIVEVIASQGKDSVNKYLTPEKQRRKSRW